MPEQKPPRSLKSLFITSGLLTSAVIVTSYILFSPSHDTSPTASNNTDLPNAASTNTAAEDKHLNPDIVPDLINGVDKAQLLALLPEVSPEDELAAEDKQPLSLWQPVEQGNATADSDQLKVETVASDPALLEELEVGRKIEFVIPQTGEALSGQITAQRTADKGVKVFDIKLDNDNSLTGGHIVRGKISTDIAVVTEQGSYTTTINNTTGAGQVIDDKDLNIYRTETDVVLVPTEAPPQPEPSS